STLAFDLAGVQQDLQYDHLDVGGPLTLGGKLAVQFSNGFQSQILAANQFTIVTGALTGAFGNVASGGRLRTADGLGSFVVQYGNSFDPNSVTLTGYLPRGDINMDGGLATNDISAMLSALTNLDQFQSAHALSAADCVTMLDL